MLVGGEGGWRNKKCFMGDLSISKSGRGSQTHQKTKMTWKRALKRRRLQIQQ